MTTAKISCVPKVFSFGSRTVYSYRLVPNQSSFEEKKKVDSLHYVMILDRSGSMYSSINQLIDQVQTLFKEMRPEDFWSLLWFNSPGSYKILLRGAKYDERLLQQLDSLRSVEGTTCFSESLETLDALIDDFSPIVSGTIVTLFTDGCPVVDDPERERRTCLRLVNQSRWKMLAFHTVGFGRYYEEDFLRSLSAETDYGTFGHISQIQDFSSLYKTQISGLDTLQQTYLSISHPSATIFYLSGGKVYVKQNEWIFGQVNLDDNLFYVLPEENCTALTIRVDDSVAMLPRSVVKTEEEAAQFPYLYALKRFQEKKNHSAIEILKERTGDAYAIEKIQDAFTYDERAAVEAMLLERVFQAEKREKNTYSIFSFTPHKVDVFDVLQTLESEEALYLPYYNPSTRNLSKKKREALSLLTTYQNVRETRRDTYNLFEPTLETNFSVPFSDLVYSEDRANLSLRFSVPGIVRLNPAAARREDLPLSYPCRQYRVHTFVKDAMLHIKNAAFSLSSVLLENLSSWNVPYTVMKQEEDRTIVIIHFEKLPMLLSYSAELSSPKTEWHSFCSMTHDLLKAKTRRKILQALQKEELREKETLSENQIQVLKDHGITSFGIYSGVDIVVDKQDDNDYYITREISSYVKGFSSLPSLKIAESLTKPSKGAEFVLMQKKTVEEELAYLSIEQLLQKTKAEILSCLRYFLSLKVKMILTGNYSPFEDLEFDKTGKATKDDIVVTMRKVKQAI